MNVYYSTKYFQTDPADPESFMPDVEVRASSAEYFSAGDPVLEAAMEWSEARRE